MSSSSPAVGAITKVLTMDDESWRRHANPWSVITRFAAIPVFAVAVWSRTWIGWWSLVPIGIVAVWVMVLNTRVFAPVGPDSWAAKGIYAEQLWASKAVEVRRDHQVILRLLIVLGLAGMALLAWGLVRLDVWATSSGAGLLVIAQLWRIDRMVWLFETVNTAAGQGRASQEPKSQP